MQLLPLFYLKMVLIQKKTYFLQTYYGDSIRRIANYMYIYNMYAFFARTFKRGHTLTDHLKKVALKDRKVIKGTLRHVIGAMMFWDFSHTPISKVNRGQKMENIHLAAVLWVTMPC